VADASSTLAAIELATKLASR